VLFEATPAKTVAIAAWFAASYPAGVDAVPLPAVPAPSA